MGTPKNNRRSGIGRSEVVIVIAVLSLVGINLPPAIEWSREVARTHHCTSNLRQIGVALLSYQGANQTLRRQYIGQQTVTTWRRICLKKLR